MKIVQCCGSYSWGGLEMQTLKIALLLRDRGHEAVIFCPEKSTLASEGKKAGVNVQTVFREKRLYHHFFRLVSFLREYKPDVIHTHLSHDLWLLVPAIYAARSDCRLFLTKRMASGVSKRDLLHRFLYNRVNNIFAISNYIKQSVLNTCPVSEEHVHLMPNSIDLDKYDHKKYNRGEIRSELGIDRDAMVIGLIGRMTPGKGHEEFLHAARIIRNIFPLSVRFLIVGDASFGEDEYRQSIHSLADQLFPDNEIVFTGFRRDVSRMLMAMDILAFPSHEESFGNVLLEAMAMNLPVVASNSGGVGDIVVDNETGILVPPRDAERLAAGLLKLVLNSDKRARFAASGRIRVEQQFSDEQFIDSLESFYHNDVITIHQSGSAGEE